MREERIKNVKGNSENVAEKKRVKEKRGKRERMKKNKLTEIGGRKERKKER